MVFLSGAMIKNPPANARDVGDMGSISGSGRSPGGGHGNLLQYSCLENPMDKEPGGTVHRVAKSQTRLKRLTSSVAQLCPTLCNPMCCNTPGFPVHRQLPELAQTHVHQVGDAIQISHPLSFPSPPAFNLSQHQGLFQWVSSSHQVAKVLELQLQHQSFQ